MSNGSYRLIFLALPLFLFADNPDLFDLKSLGYEQYQDIYINGIVVEKASNGERYSEDRFAIVNSVLKKYERPFTMLDVGASQGYFTFRAAELYPDSVFVMLEGSNPQYPKISDQLASICELNSHMTNVIWLNDPIIPQKIDLLSTSEHFDVILALNILHWFPDNWENLLASFRKISHVVIVEVPPLEPCLSPENMKTRQNLHAKLSSIATTVLAGVPRHCNSSLYTTFYIIENPSYFTLMTTTLLHPNYGDREHTIFCDFKTKTLTKTRVADHLHESTNNWIPGVNLLTYLVFNGAFPTRQNLIHFLPVDSEHDDWMPNNFILQGSKMSLIDNHDPKRASIIYYDTKLEREIQEFILNTAGKNLDEIKRLFGRLRSK